MSLAREDGECVFTEMGVPSDGDIRSAVSENVLCYESIDPSDINSDRNATDQADKRLHYDSESDLGASSSGICESSMGSV